MDISCVIPARYGSTRFPGKPTAKINNKAMILHTMERVVASSVFGRVICATDSKEIAHIVTTAGFDAVITPESFLTGSDRVAWVAEKENLDFVVNVQGDEPLVDYGILKSISEQLQQYTECWITACCPISEKYFQTESVVKVIVDNNGFATDFVREYTGSKRGVFKHKGIYAYSAENVKNFTESKQSESEKKLSLEQLRVFPQVPFKVIFTEHESHSVDVPADIAIIEQLINKSKESLYEQV